MSGKPPSGRCTGSVRKIDGPSFQPIHNSRVFIAAFTRVLFLLRSRPHTQVRQYTFQSLPRA